MKNSRRVYSTESGRIRQPAPAQSGPPLCAAPQATDDGVVRIFRERGGRNGKVVTVIRGLPARDLEARATEPPWDPTEKKL
jgi:translation initiation factor 1